jgi:hypothetical protein
VTEIAVMVVCVYQVRTIRYVNLQGTLIMLTVDFSSVTLNVSVILLLLVQAGHLG